MVGIEVDECRGNSFETLNNKMVMFVKMDYGVLIERKTFHVAQFICLLSTSNTWQLLSSFNRHVACATHALPLKKIKSLYILNLFCNVGVP